MCTPQDAGGIWCGPDVETMSSSHVPLFSNGDSTGHHRNPSDFVTIATDGSCLKNPGGASGWAWFVSETCWAAGGIKTGTNQQAELMALLAALRAAPTDVPVLLLMDSQYALKAATEWIPSWKKRGWKKADGSPVMNLELMQDIDRALAARTAATKFKWVRGHQGNPLNERVDFLCGRAARQVARALPVEPGPGWN